MATFHNRFSDIDILAAARWTHPAFAQTLTLHPAATNQPQNEHAYSWAVKLPGYGDQRFSIDLHGYVKALYGSGCQVVQKDMTRHGWKRFYPNAPEQNYTIQPVVFVAKDKVYDPGISQGVDNFRHNIGAMADWVQDKVGKGLKILEPQVFVSDKTAAEWLTIYKDQADRFDTWGQSSAEVLKAYGNKTNSKVIYVVAQYCGLNCFDWDWDAAGGPIVILPSQGHVACVSAFACCWRYAPNTPTHWDDTLIYALVHELLHCFGLQHTPDTVAQWTLSIMQSARPPEAILIASDRQHLLTAPANAPFFV